MQPNHRSGFSSRFGLVVAANPDCESPEVREEKLEERKKEGENAYDSQEAVTTGYEKLSQKRQNGRKDPR